MTEKIPIKHIVHAVTASATLKDGIVLKFLSDPSLSSEDGLIELKFPDGSLSRLRIMVIGPDSIKVECSDIKFDLQREAQYSYKLRMSPSEADIRHGLQFVITGSGDIHPGTDIAMLLPEGETRKLTIVLKKNALLWLALWHDETRQSIHDGQLFRIFLVPPVEYEDDVPVERKFMVEIVGDHELASPRSSGR